MLDLKPELQAEGMIPFRGRDAFCGALGKNSNSACGFIKDQ